MDLRPPYLDTLRDLDLHELLRIGDAATDVLGRLASQCQERIWIIDIVKEVLPRPWPIIEPLVDPWWPIPPDPEPDPAPWMHGNTLVEAALGGALYALGSEFRDPSPEMVDRADDYDWAAAVRPGIQVVARETVRTVERSRRGEDELARALAEEGGSERAEARFPDCVLSRRSRRQRELHGSRRVRLRPAVRVPAARAGSTPAPGASCGGGHACYAQAPTRRRGSTERRSRGHRTPPDIPYSSASPNPGTGP